uniref:DUF4238 domain-containing protein n=1 Tax=Candidatus Electrothrix sp. TaxID=2170559 RepID=UPI004057C129
MAYKKKQHYVPRFYLKNFSSDNSSGRCRAINLFNIPSYKKILNAKLYNQCYQNYFYGKDGTLENILERVEGKASQIISEIILKCELTDKYTFLFYTVLQYFRTLYSAESMDEHTDKFYKTLIKKDILPMGVSDEQLSFVKIVRNNSPLHSVQHACLYHYLACDLDLKILRICTKGLEFISSDNPVVFYNQFMPFHKMGSNIGLASKGLQIFFPISPKHLVVLYDGAIYGVGKKKHKLVELREKRDVEQLNRLQFVSALENVYFSDRNYAAYNEYLLARNYRRTNKQHVKSYPQKNGGYLIGSYKEDIRTDLELSFIKILKKAKRWRKEFEQKRFQPATTPVRNENLYSDHERFLKLVKEKQYTPGDFFRFLYDQEVSQSYTASNCQSKRQNHD